MTVKTCFPFDKRLQKPQINHWPIRVKQTDLPNRGIEGKPCALCGKDMAFPQTRRSICPHVQRTGLRCGVFSRQRWGSYKKGRYTTCSHPAGGEEISKQANLPGPGVTSVRKDMTDHILYMTPHWQLLWSSGKPPGMAAPWTYTTLHHRLGLNLCVLPNLLVDSTFGK